MLSLDKCCEIASSELLRVRCETLLITNPLYKLCPTETTSRPQNGMILSIRPIAENMRALAMEKSDIMTQKIHVE